MRDPKGMATRPHVLLDNRVPVYYAGGSNINQFRNLPDEIMGPEDWVGSLVPLPAAILGPEADPSTGISRLDGDVSLAALVAADADGWLGPDLSSAYGGSSALLVKLLDAGERLPVHCHPTRPFAQRHLGSLFGKTEGWVIMRTSPGARIWIGFENDLDRGSLKQWIDNGDVDSMLAAMLSLPVSAGDVIYVPAGVPHAIGPGIMLTELQEPTSFSILAEYENFGVSADVATLGLGWDLALSCFDFSGYGRHVDKLVHVPQVIHRESGGTVERLFGAEADDFFRALRVRSTESVALPEASFGIAVVNEGAGTLTWADGVMEVVAGMTLVVPFGAGVLTFGGSLDVTVCQPPTTGAQGISI